MRVKTKVDVPADKSPTDSAYRSGEELQLSDEDGKALVKAGFADELDERGYLIDGTPSNPQPGSGTASAAESASDEDDLESKTNDELREMGGTGRTKAELIESLSG